MSKILDLKIKFDIIYSISVIEHIQSNLRRKIFFNLQKCLKKDGKFILTIDLYKRSKWLWNYNEGKEVERKREHGSLNTIIKELKQNQIILESKNVIRLKSSEKIDIALLIFRNTGMK